MSGQAVHRLLLVYPPGAIITREPQFRRKRRCPGTKVAVFCNNVTPDEMSRPGYLDSGERLFVRSTVCWPAKYVEMACPSVVPLHEEISGLIG